MGKGSFVGYETINLTPPKWIPRITPVYQLHMKAKGRWQVLEWRVGKDADYKFVVRADNLTHKQAQGILKLIEEV
jgi:hypothetical protein